MGPTPNSPCSLPGRASILAFARPTRGQRGWLVDKFAILCDMNNSYFELRQVRCTAKQSDELHISLFFGSHRCPKPRISPGRRAPPADNFLQKQQKQRKALSRRSREGRKSVK